MRIWSLVSSDRCLAGFSGFELTVKHLSCGPIVAELTLPILAHEPSFIFTVVSLLRLVCARGVGHRCIMSGWACATAG